MKKTDTRALVPPLPPGTADRIAHTQAFAPPRSGKFAADRPRSSGPGCSFPTSPSDVR